MIRRTIIFLTSLLTLAAAPGCLDIFEGIWYANVAVEEYTWFHQEVPDEYLELLSLEGTDTGDGEGAPTLYGLWAHQCIGDNDCAPHDDHPEFNPANRGRTILYFHGNTQNLMNYLDRVQILWRMGFEVFAIDYRGFGMSTGAPSEEGIYADARTALEHVQGRLAPQVPDWEDGDALPSPDSLGLIVYGFSLGTAPAIQLSLENRFPALVTESALAGAQAFTDSSTALGLSSSVLMDTEFNNIEKISDVEEPKLMMHARGDTFVVFEFSEMLFERAEEPKVFYPVDGGEHSYVPCPEAAGQEEGEGERYETNPCSANAAYTDMLGEFVSTHVTPL